MNVDFLTAIKLFFANYANFRGRSTRAEYWWVALFLVIVSLAFSMLKLNLLSTIFSLAVFIPSLAIAFRRFHDTGRSGGYVGVFYQSSCGHVLRSDTYTRRRYLAAHHTGHAECARQQIRP